MHLCRVYLASHAMRTQFSKAKRRGDFPQQSDYVQVFDATFGVWIILTPQADELVQMVGPQDRPISCQIVKVVHDDRNKQINDLENRNLLYFTGLMIAKFPRTPFFTQ